MSLTTRGSPPLVAQSLQGGWCDYLAGTAAAGVSLEGDAAVVELETAPVARRARHALAGRCGWRNASETGRVEAGRTVDYRQTAVTARVTSTAAHAHVAYERFTPEGPLALLPAGDELALVWSTTPERAQRTVRGAGARTSWASCKQAFGNRLGRFTAVERRGMFPLALRVARDAAAPRTVRIGNAAQTLHPVAGQGLNLGPARRLGARRGTAALRRASASARRSSSPGMRRGGGSTAAAGSGLPMAWCGFSPAISRRSRCARGLGLAALAALPPAQDFLVRRMSFGARG